jgi:hypothetical protein
MHNKHKGYIPDIAILFCLNIIFFYKIIFINHFLYSTAELLSIYFPCSRYIGSCLRQGFFPLWDPYYFLDFVGVSVPGVFYPFNLVVSYIGSFLSLNNSFLLIMADIFLHTFMAGVFMYVLLRKFAVRRVGSLLGAIAFVYSGFVAKSLAEIGIIHTLVWFPLVFLFFVKAVEGRYRYSVYAAIALALAFFAGYAALTFYMCAVLILYAFGRFFSVATLDAPTNKPIRIIAATIITFTVAGALSAIQLLPMVAYAMNSVRKGVTYEHLVMWGSVPPLHFITLIMPHFFGGAGVEHWGAQLVDPVGYWEVVYYAGIFAIFFAALGFCFRSREGEKRYLQYFLLFLILFSIFMMTGKYSSLFGMCYSLRFFMLSRVPTRWGFFLDFSIAVLAGIGFGYISGPLVKDTKKKITYIFEKWMQPLSKWLLLPLTIIIIPLCMKSHWPSIGSIIHFVIFYFLILLFMFLRLKLKYHREYAVFLLTFVFLDLFFASVRINPFSPAYPAYPPAPPAARFENNPALDFFASDKDTYRVSGLPWPFFQWQPHRVSTLGYLGGFSYRRLAEFRGERDPMGSGGLDWFSLRPDYLSQWIDFYNIKYLVSQYDLSGHFPHKYERVPGFMDLYRNKNVFPRAYFVSDYEVIADSKLILERMQYIDLGKTVVLEESPGFLAEKESGVNRVAITKYMPLEIELETETKKKGLLVISDLYFPGWSVWVDGEKSKILRANYCFRAIRLNAGMHKVYFKYSSLSVKVGLIFFCITSLVLVVIFLRLFLLRKK